MFKNQRSNRIIRDNYLSDCLSGFNISFNVKYFSKNDMVLKNICDFDSKKKTMGNLKRKYSNTSLNPNENLLYNPDTSELQAVKNANMWVSTATGEFEVSYNNYNYLDTNFANILLSRGIKQVDLALLISISTRLLNKYNIVMQDQDKPHTTASIAKIVRESPQGVRIKLKRLEQQGLLAYTTLEEKKNWGKVYIVNPHFIKKGRDYKESIIKMFKDPSYDKVVIS